MQPSVDVNLKKKGKDIQTPKDRNQYQIPEVPTLLGVDGVAGITNHKNNF